MADIRITDIAKELDKITAQVIGQFTTNVVENLRAPPAQGGTPRDTGHASANWIARAGEPATEIDGSKDNVSSSLQEIGLQAMARYKLSDGTVTVSNNVPYIGRLNDGSSKQAPVGFIESGTLRAAQDLE